MLSLRREKELFQAGYEIGLTVDHATTPVQDRPNKAIEAADALRLKGEARMAFLAGSGAGRCERLGQEIKERTACRQEGR